MTSVVILVLSGLAMRLILACLTATVLCGAALGEGIPLRDFTLAAESVEAIEDGPVVVRLTLTYKGEKPVELVGPCDLQGLQFEVTGPSNWKRAPEPAGFIFNGAVGPTTINPGDHFSAVLFLHHRFSAIPTGKAKLTFTWHLSQFKDNDPKRFDFVTVASPSVASELDVAASTPERFAALRKRMEEILDRRESTPEQEDQVADTVSETRHDALMPIAFRLLQAEGPYRSYRRLRLTVYDWSRRATKNHVQLVKFLHDHGQKSDYPFFDSWREDKVELSGEDIRTLLGSENIWVKAYTSSRFPTLCPAGTKAILEADVARIRDRNATEKRPEIKASVETDLERLDRLLRGPDK